MENDHSNMKLGKLAPVHDPRTLMLANYLTPDTLPAVPAKYYYAKNIKASAWGMMNNDKIGDCTCAAALRRVRKVPARKSHDARSHNSVNNGGAS